VQGIERTSLIGQSLGGGVAIQFATDHPDRVEKLVLVCSAGMHNPEPLAARLLALPGIGEAMFNLPGDALRRKMLTDFFLYRSGSLAQETYRYLTRPHKIEGSTASALALMRGQFADRLEDQLPRLAALRMPLQIVWGEQDRAIPLSLGRRMHQALPGSILNTIPQAGHVPNLEQPELFNALVGDFLRDETSSTPDSARAAT
jgi:pimeloyl-ACP methyl ester carboxylesterase